MQIIEKINQKMQKLIYFKKLQHNKSSKFKDFKKKMRLNPKFR